MGDFSLQNLTQILQMQLGGNTVLQLAIAVIVFIAVYIVLHIVKGMIVRHLKKISEKTSSKMDDVAVSFLKEIRAPVYGLIAFYVALKGISVPSSLTIVVDAIFVIVIVSQVIKLVDAIIIKLIAIKMKKDEAPAIINVSVKFVLWAVGILLILSNLGINVNSLVAGLGIGGLAISLALQSVLGDLFSSVSIAVDKPFEEGDFIVVGEHKGTVKKIGLKTTRVEALQGEEIVLSNTELTTARVQNFKKMHRRRVLFHIGVTYDTPIEKLKKVEDIIEEACGEHKEKVEFDRVHFQEFGDSNLIFEVVYYMQVSDYNVYMDTQESINFKILEEFEKEGIEMAYPTQTLYVKKD